MPRTTSEQAANVRALLRVTFARTVEPVDNRIRPALSTAFRPDFFRLGEEIRGIATRNIAPATRKSGHLEVNPASSTQPFTRPTSPQLLETMTIVRANNMSTCANYPLLPYLPYLSLVVNSPSTPPVTQVVAQAARRVEWPNRGIAMTEPTARAVPAGALDFTIAAFLRIVAERDQLAGEVRQLRANLDKKAADRRELLSLLAQLCVSADGHGNHKAVLGELHRRISAALVAVPAAGDGS